MIQHDPMLQKPISHSSHSRKTGTLGHPMAYSKQVIADDESTVSDVDSLQAWINSENTPRQTDPWLVDPSWNLLVFVPIYCYIYIIYIYLYICYIYFYLSLLWRIITNPQGFMFFWGELNLEWIDLPAGEHMKPTFWMLPSAKVVFCATVEI